MDQGLALLYNVLRQNHLSTYNGGKIHPDTLWEVGLRYIRTLPVSAAAALLYEMMITSGQELDLIWRFVIFLFSCVTLTPLRKIIMVTYQCHAPADPVLRSHLPHFKCIWWSKQFFCWYRLSDKKAQFLPICHCLRRCDHRLFLCFIINLIVAFLRQLYVWMFSSISSMVIEVCSFAVAEFTMCFKLGDWRFGLWNQKNSSSPSFSGVLLLCYQPSISSLCYGYTRFMVGAKKVGVSFQFFSLTYVQLQLLLFYSSYGLVCGTDLLVPCQPDIYLAETIVLYTNLCCAQYLT